MDCLMGIDLGSTSLKAIVYDLDGNVLASGSRPTEQFHPDPHHPQWTVWQPEQIWGGAAAAISEAVSQLAEPRSIRAVAVTGMGMDGLPVDDEGGWLYPFISWHDPRTVPAVRLVARAHRRSQGLLDRRQSPLAYQHRPADPMDGRARAGNPRRAPTSGC